MLVTVVMLIAALVGTVRDAKECETSGGILVAAGTRGSLCVGGW